jgi:hypothetical protein
VAILDQVWKGRTRRGLACDSLNFARAASRIRIGQESMGIRRPGEGRGHTPRLLDVRQCPSNVSRNKSGLWLWAPASCALGRRDNHCVFATRGGTATVLNCVASSTAGPNGVGMVMRNGTRIRVPAIGTSTISIRRSVARYLITGRSGM